MGGTIPPVSLWQVLQILPLLITVRPQHHTRTLRDLTYDRSFCSHTQRLPPARRTLLVPRRAHRGEPIYAVGSDTESES
jgi:hypothetical protein